MRGLYAITDAALIGPRLTSAVAAAIDGGAQAVQYRDKSHDGERRRREARALAELCRERGVSLLINDDVALAAECGAHGVHLGRDDGDIAAARARLGPDVIIGVSCYNEFELARRAASAGADYVAFGSFFPSRIKPEAVRAEPALLQRAKRELAIPTVAIGGITADNGATLVAAGADMLAVISVLFGADDIRASAARLSALFD